MNNALLPSGLYDLLPPEARRESEAVQSLLRSFLQFGYEQVSPPLMEFENSLLASRGEALLTQIFRVMDPLSQQMMGFRADMTMQIARIASTRMQAMPRPLRLCYAGPTLQVTPEQLKNERQHMQAGIELIGAESEDADAEVVTVAVVALKALGLQQLSVDLNLPSLLDALLEKEEKKDALRKTILEHVIRKDSAAIAALPIRYAATIARMIGSAGSADTALAALNTMDLPAAACAMRERLSCVTKKLAVQLPGISITVDALETRGFEYHDGISFSLFAGGVRGEAGRGGRYAIGEAADAEPATGFTLYVENLLRALPVPATLKKIYVPFDTPREESEALRAQGYATLHGLAKETSVTDEAKPLGCDHIAYNGKIEKR